MSYGGRAHSQARKYIQGFLLVIPNGDITLPTPFYDLLPFATNSLLRLIPQGIPLEFKQNKNLLNHIFIEILIYYQLLSLP